MIAADSRDDYERNQPSSASGTNNNLEIGINLVVLDDFLFSEPVAGGRARLSTWA